MQRIFHAKKLHKGKKFLKNEEVVINDHFDRRNVKDFQNLKLILEKILFSKTPKLMMRQIENLTQLISNLAKQQQ